MQSHFLWLLFLYYFCTVFHFRGGDFLCSADTKSASTKRKEKTKESLTKKKIKEKGKGYADSSAMSLNPKPLFKSKIMANLSSFDHLWSLLNPASEYLRKRKDVQSLWDTIPLQKQRVIYRVIRDKKEKGLRLHPNPFFALEDNINVEPEFLTGTQQDEAWDNNIPLVMVKYQGNFRICTKEIQELFDLEFVMDWSKFTDE